MTIVGCSGFSSQQNGWGFQIGFHRNVRSCLNKSKVGKTIIINHPSDWEWFIHCFTHITVIQWEFQDPKLEVPTIYKVYVRPM
jgi:hypothetical protein